MLSNRLFGKILAMFAAMALLLGACGSDEDASSEDDLEEAAASCEASFSTDDSVDSLTELDFSGMSFNVGSKNYVEQFVLSSLLIVALEAGGATVTDSTNLGGTQVNREALLAGEIDAYFEYNGTGASLFLEDDNPSFDSDVLTHGVCVEDLAKNNVRWVGRSEFNDTFAFATAPNSPAKVEDLEEMVEYLEENPDANICFEVEFASRADGIGLLEEAAGKTVPEAQIDILETGVIYDQTAKGECTFGEVYTTDGRVAALELELIDSPEAFILYNVSLNLMEDTYQEAPEAFEAVADTILGGLDNETMAELNRQVAIDGENALDVATAYLTAQGLL